jgi:hypothetical protein
MKNSYIEVKLFTEEQAITIMPNLNRDGVKISISEEGRETVGIYLTSQEAEDFADEIKKYIK